MNSFSFLSLRSGGAPDILRQRLRRQKLVQKIQGSSIHRGLILGLMRSRVNPPSLFIGAPYGVEDFLAAQAVGEGSGVRDLHAVFAQCLSGLTGQVIERARPAVVRKD